MGNIFDRREKLLKKDCNKDSHADMSKVNENIKPMYIGDFVELFVTLMNPSIPFNRKIIRDKLQSGFDLKYIYEAPHGDITTRCSNIFE